MTARSSRLRARIGPGAVVAAAALLLSCVEPAHYPALVAPHEPLPPGIDVTGAWMGSAFSFGMELAYSLEVQQQGARVTGTGRSATRDDRFKARYEVEGLVSEGTLYLKGVRFLEKTTERYTWCLPTMKLEYADDEMGVRLGGEMGPSPEVEMGCPPFVHGTLVLEPWAGAPQWSRSK